MTLLKKTLGGLLVAATLAASATPAEARYRHYRHHNSGAVITAGIIGLGVGAAIASSSRGRYYDPYYDRYYGRPYYYDDGYYGRPYYRGYRNRYRHHCVTRRVWDPYWGRTVRVRYC